MNYSQKMPNSYQEVFYYDGAVRADQPLSGYRAGIDAVLLAQSLAPKQGQSVLELGVGSGVVLKCLHNKFPNARYVGIDLNPDMLALAHHNTADIAAIEIALMDVGAMNVDWNLSFDFVIANPPFFNAASDGRMSEAKAPSFVAGPAKLADWGASMVKALKPRGTGVMIYRADGIDAVMRALGPQAGQVEILPIHPFADAAASLVIVRFRKGVKSRAKIWPALILHERDSAQKYTKRATQVLNGAQALFSA